MLRSRHEHHQFKLRARGSQYTASRHNSPCDLHQIVANTTLNNKDNVAIIEEVDNGIERRRDLGIGFDDDACSSISKFGI